MRSLALSITTLAALTGCGSGGDEPPAAPARPNVLLIVVDTLRRDHLSAYDYERPTSPALERFAATAVRYDRAISQAPWTTPSLAALFTSQYPSTIGIKSEKAAIAPDLVLLGEVLRDAGYITGAAVSHHFCNSTWGFDQGFTHFDESNVQGHAAVTSTGVTERALAFLDEFGGAEEPFFLWLHYFDPHCAYVEHDAQPFGNAADYLGPVKSGQLFAELQKLQSELVGADLDELRRLYDSEIAYTDAQVGRVLARLDALGLAEETLVVFTADHGEEFKDHGRLGHAKTLHEELIGVPLIIRFPGRGASIVQEPVGLIDIYPTVLEATGVPVPEGLAGLPIAPGSAHLDPERIVFSETARMGGLRAAVSGSHKLIQIRRGQREELYAASDTGETTNLYAEQGPARTRLRDALAEFAALQAAGRVAPEVAPDAATQQHLSDMGYGGGDADD